MCLPMYLLKIGWVTKIIKNWQFFFIEESLKVWFHINKLGGGRGGDGHTDAHNHLEDLRYSLTKCCFVLTNVASPP